MISEELFEKIQEKACEFKYTSMKYTDYTEVAKFDVLRNDENLILLRGYDDKMSWIDYHFAANSVDELLGAIELNDKLHISFVPREWVDSFKQRGFEMYAVFNDYFNNDISNVEVGETPEFLAESECEEAALVTQACKGQSRGFHGETAEWVRSWIRGEEPSANEIAASHFAALIHRENQKIVGVLFTSIYAHQSPKGPVVWIREVAVHPDYQRKGIGRKLILQTLNYGKAHGAKRAFLAADECNENAIHLYESLGFVGNKEEGQIDMILP